MFNSHTSVTNSFNSVVKPCDLSEKTLCPLWLMNFEQGIINKEVEENIQYSTINSQYSTPFTL